MSFAEYLTGDSWREFLERTFDATLTVLETDPFCTVGSAADDLRAWLRVGGAPRVRHAVATQTSELRLAPPHRDEVLQEVDRLLERHRPRILALTARGLIPCTDSALGA